MSLQEEIDKISQEIRTDGYSMSIGEWMSLYQSNEIDINPDFQRFFRWSEHQKSTFIESILLGIPIPPIFVSQRDDGVWDVVDGVQRLSTIYEFTGLLKKNDQEENTDPVALQKLSMDARFKYVMIFKNYGSSAGATVEHTHSQIIAMPMVPKTVLEELKGAEHYHQYRGRCVFCDMIVQEYQDRERIVVENHSFLAFCPFAPRYAFETWIIPKGHNADFALSDEATQTDLAQILQDVLKRIKKVLKNPSYNYYLHTAPIGYANGSCYHWHIEIIPKLTRSVGFEWGTGLHIVPTFPQDAARFLREA